VNELYKFVNIYVFVFSSIFLVLFVVYNEISKVREIQKFYKGFKSSKFAIIGTFIISFFLSITGIYFWTNNTLEVKVALNNDLKQKELVIEQSYQLKVDSLNNVPVSSPEYSKLVEDIEFWRNRKSDTKEQRQEILKNIRILEEKRENLYNTIKNERKSEIERIDTLKSNKLALLSTQNLGKEKNMNKNNFISWVFILMVVVTEFIILNVQRQISTFYTSEQKMIINIVKECELRNLTKIDVNEFKYSFFNKNREAFIAKTSTEDDWRETNKAHNLLRELNIISKEDELIAENASEFLTRYFIKINQL
jgi:hypothetical protein